MRKIIRFTALLIIVNISCKQPEGENVESLLKIDKNFSDSSLKYGYNWAFLMFAAKDAVILRDSSMPIKGIDKIAQLFDTSKTEQVILVWDPIDGKISESGDLGFTYGTYKVTSLQAAEEVLGNGCYTTFWQKNKNGDWKWVMDCGTEGLETTTHN